MGQLKVSDNAATTLAASLTSSPVVTSMTLTDASKFPVINNAGTGSDWTWLTLFDSNNLFEIVKVTRRDNAANTLTIVRGTAMGLSGYTDADCKAWASTTTGVACRMIAGAFNDIAGAAASATASAAAAAASSASAVSAVTPIASVAGIIKGNGAGGYSAAAANTDYTNFAAGTRLVFAQSSAPTGWTQDTSDNATNRMLRVVNTAGGGVGGTHSPILNNVVPAHTHGITVNATDTNHTHGFTTDVQGNHAHNYTAPSGEYAINLGVQNFVMDNTGGAVTDYQGAHSHSGTTGWKNQNAAHSHSASSDSGSSQTNWQPRYIDMIICTKN